MADAAWSQDISQIAQKSGIRTAPDDVQRLYRQHILRQLSAVIVTTYCGLAQHAWSQDMSTGCQKAPQVYQRRLALCTGMEYIQQHDIFLGAGGPMDAETMSLPPRKEYRSRLGVPGLELDRSRVPFVAAAIKVLFTCTYATT